MIEHMFECVGTGRVDAGTVAGTVAGWRASLAQAEVAGEDHDRVAAIRELEDLKAAAAAAQARLAAALDASQRAAQADAGVPASRRGQGIASQVGLARRCSPVRGAQQLGLAKVLQAEMPHTLAAMTEGWLSEWRAMLLARETACVSLEARRRIDAELAGDRALIETYGDARLAAEARRLAYRYDPEAVVARRARAEAERNVTLRPAPDTMSYLTGLLPVAQGVAVRAALTKHADALRATGDGRSRGQIMADTLVERVTGQAVADGVEVHVDVVMTDRALLEGDDEPATLPGYGVVPASYARHLIGTAALHEAAVWTRRLFTMPTTGELVAMDSRARIFPAGLARLVDVRDGTCRTPWCDAPIRHRDHVVPFETGGPTTAANGQGLCEACNHAKQAPGWAARPAWGARHTVRITTPAGHGYRSTAPPLPGTRSPGATRVEAVFADVVLAWAG